MKNIRFLLISLVLCSQLEVFAQSPSNLENKILYGKEWTLDILLHSNNSWGLGFRSGKHKTYFRHKMYEIELMGMKHPKETKTQNPVFTSARKYVFGKLNSFYILHAGIGTQRLLNTKPYWGGVEVKYILMGGLSLGMTIPNYLYVITRSDDFGNYKIEAAKASTKIFNNQDTIYGNGPILKGIWETKFHPGIYAKAGLSFEFGGIDQTIWELEIGGFVDGYLTDIPIMAYTANQRLFTSVYLSLHFGKRKN
ncbi:MAG: hypothetical protein WCH34_13095 [Bacteroidota bacterium]